jgi:hypothetical protein
VQRTKKEGPRPIEELIRSFLRESGIGGGRSSGERVYRAWKEALGSQGPARARPVRFRNGELQVEVDSASLLQELRNFTGEGFRARANQILGAETIRRVTFKLRG